MISLGQRIRQCRKLLGTTQAQLAEDKFARSTTLIIMVEAFCHLLQAIVIARIVDLWVAKRGLPGLGHRGCGQKHSIRH